MKDVLPARLSHAIRLSRANRTGLSQKVVADARPRIVLAGVIGMGAFAVFLLLAAAVVNLDASVSRDSAGMQLFLIQDVLGLLICSIVFAVAVWRSAFSDRAAMVTLLVAEFLVCAVISLFMPWATYAATGSIPPITWAIPVIILVPLVIPTPPWYAGATAFASMLTIPLAIAGLERFGVIESRPFEVVQLTLAGLVAVVMAYAGSRALFTARQIADVGKYRLLNPIDEGGNGSVYRAEHGFLARPAAVKVIRRDLLKTRAARDVMVHRFIREARVTAKLRSPHTVRLFDFGETGELDPRQRSLFIAMELLEGINLEHFVYTYAPSGVEARRAAHWLRQACRCLGEAHDLGIIHRDVKPRNMMVCRMGREADFIKVLDFGITKSIDEDPNAERPTPSAGTQTTGLTQTGVRLGTPGYMSPEQITRDRPIGPASDIYALGCVAYFLLAGRKPFEGSSDELARQHLYDAPPALGEIATEPIPAGVAGAVMQCLAKDPGDRPRDVDELARRLNAAAGAAWTDDEASAWWASNVPAAGA